MGRQKHAYQAVTIRDVAKLAEVSISTVSRVLNGLDRVSEETRRRVYDAVQKLGYSPNTFATSMVTGQTKIVMIVVPNIVQDFYGYMVQYAEQTFRANGYLPMLMSYGTDPGADPLSYLQRFAHMIEGAVVVPTPEALSGLRQFPKPVVIIDRDMEDSGLNSVTLDNYAGCYRLTQLLLENNHRKIAVIAGSTEMNVGRDRFHGCCQAMLDAGLLPDARYLRRGEMSRDYGYNHTCELLSQKDPPTAIVACGENFGIGALCACIDMNLQPGRDVSLVCFDDLSPIAYPRLRQFLRPAIFRENLLRSACCK